MFHSEPAFLGRTSHSAPYLNTHCRQSLPTDLLNPLNTSFEYISTHPAGGADETERQRQKIILLNSLWTWNAFVKEWRSVKLPVGQQLMAEVRSQTPVIG